MPRERRVMRGEELPTLLLGNTLIDLGQVRSYCNHHDLQIEFYEEPDSDWHLPSRFFIGRDYGAEPEMFQRERDYRVELTTIVPELLRHRMVETSEFRREEGINDLGSGMVNAIPSFRLYEIALRPPFTERFLLRTERESNYDLKAILKSDKAREVAEEIRQKKCPHCWTPCEAHQMIMSNWFKK